MQYSSGWNKKLLALLVGLATQGALAAEPDPQPAQHFALQRVEVAVAAQPLPQALALFASQTGLQIQLADNLPANQFARPVNGRMTAQQALTVLLAGTGLDFHFSAKNQVVIQPQTPVAADAATVLPAVTISSNAVEDAWGAANGYVATHSATGTKTDAAIVEIPQSISVVTRQDMEDRGVNTVMDAVVYSAGVNAEVSGIDSRVDDVRVRGFDVSSWTNSMYLDGLRLPRGGQWSTPQVDAYGLERVEIIKGPAAVLYGQVAPGGLVNMVAKRPTAEQVNEVGLTYSSFNQIEGTLDVGGSLTTDKRITGRFVSAINDGDSQVDETRLGRTYVAPSLRFLLGDNSELTLLSYYQKDEGGSTFQFLPTKGVKYPTEYGYIGRETFLGEPDWNTYDRTQWAIGYDFSHYFNDVWSFRQNLKHSRLDSLFRTVVSATFTNDGLLPDNRTMNRRAVQGDGELEATSIDNQLKASFDTGNWSHETLIGLDHYRNDWTHLRDLVYRFPVPPIDVYNPQYSGVDGFESHLVAQMHSTAKDQQTGVYLQDLIAVQDWRISLGLRHDRFDFQQDNRSEIRPDSQVDESDSATTWRAGLTYLFENGMAPYASYATSFEPVNDTDVEGNPYEPTEGQQLEAGLKYQPLNSNSLYTLSVFELEQTNLVIPDPSANAGDTCFPDCTTQAGETRTRGIELEAKTWVQEGLSLSGSYTFLDAKVTEGEPGIDGKRKEFVPRHSAGLWLNYKWNGGWLTGLSLGGGARYTGSIYGDPENSVAVDSHTLLDMALRYDMKHLGAPGLLLSLTGRNLEDKDYLSSCTTYGCSYGSARVISASAQYRW